MNEESLKKLIADREEEKYKLLLETYKPNQPERLLKLNEKIAWLNGELFQLRRVYSCMVDGTLIYED